MRKKADPSGRRWFEYFKNPLSTYGLVFSVAAGIFHVSLYALELGEGINNPYLNIWFHIIVPPFVVFGFVLALFGAWREKRRIQRGVVRAPGIPMSRQRKSMVLGVGLVLVLFVPFLGFTTYTGYHYTDSVEFCGRACHQPMNAVFSAYQVSPHARVSCSSCHIGEGASWFVHSKLSGTRQVFATLFDSYERPIETPIKDLRPARETCERCHWPEKAFGSRVVDLPHFAADEESTRRPLSMVLKTGGGDPSQVSVRGIHWHSIAANAVEYVATDKKRLEIPWVKMTTEGETHIFRSDGLPADAPPPEGELRVMDCLDCHNRPSHNYHSPDELSNRLLSLGMLDPSFPFIKRETARLMSQPYEDTPSAQVAITEGLRAFYRDNYPELADTRADELDQCIESVLETFGQNVFPEMKTDWRTHPDHIGHKYSPGCFRCHDDRHVSEDGAFIRRDCNLCHEFMEHRDSDGDKVLAYSQYSHPFELKGAHEELDCHSCHDGGPTPTSSCQACHGEVADFIAGSLSGLPQVVGDPDPHYGELECFDCHEEHEAFSNTEVMPMCLDCHDEEDVLETISSNFDALQEALDGAEASAAFLELDRVRPTHNVGFALKVLTEAVQPPSAGSD